MNETQTKIIALLLEIDQLPTVKRRLDLFRLGIQFAKETGLKLSDAHVIEEIDCGMYQKSDGLEYTLNAYVWYCNQIYDVFLTGRLHTTVVQAAGPGGYQVPPSAPELAISHAWFSDVLITLPGDPDQEPVCTIPEKTLIELVLQMATDKKFEELILDESHS